MTQHVHGVLRLTAREGDAIVEFETSSTVTLDDAVAIARDFAQRFVAHGPAVRPALEAPATAPAPRKRKAAAAPPPPPSTPAPPPEPAPAPAPLQNADEVF